MDEQPRDEKGQFASTGEGAADGGSGKPLAEKYPGLKGASKKELKEYDSLKRRVEIIRGLANEAKAKGDLIGFQAGVNLMERRVKELTKLYDTIAKRQDRAHDSGKELKSWAKKKTR